MRIANTHLAVITLILACTVGCAATPDYAQGGMKDSQTIAPVFDPSFKAQRLATKGVHFSWVMTRSIYENPVNRPVSHMSSLASFTLKSTGGMLRRVVIGTAQLPALTGDIPAVSGAEAMDLQAFEKQLDRITGTRTNTGRIEFLVDGDEYFCRLTSAIENAEESVDIRTYIFDNDDYAIEVADKLKKRSDDVRVRVMFDGLGNMIATHTDSDNMPLEHRVPLSISAYLETNSDVKVRSTTNPWLTSDHTKTTIIDKKVA